MTQHSPSEKPTRSTQFLDLLLDALWERQAARQQAQNPASQPALKPIPRAAEADTQVATVSAAGKAQPASARDGPSEAWQPPVRPPTMHLERTLTRMLMLVVILLVVINIPVNRYGASLARLLPDSASLVIREGLVLKGSGPRIYIVQQDRLRWISSMDAFEHMGLQWSDVHVVEDSFLEHFEMGKPIHVLLKCPDSPHIYRLENDQKRWIRDIDTFLAEGHVWEDVRMVDCATLRAIADGPPIPEDAGTAPQP
jgi:hypothetical protein